MSFQRLLIATTDKPLSNVTEISVVANPLNKYAV